MEQQLRDSEEKYRQVFENATFGIFRATPDGTLLDVNPALVAMLGYDSKEELLTRNLPRDIYEDPNARQAIIDKYRPTGVWRVSKPIGSAKMARLSWFE
jgi:PAS domain S-box-containing protein